MNLDFTKRGGKKGFRYGRLKKAMLALKDNNFYFAETRDKATSAYACLKELGFEAFTEKATVEGVTGWCVWKVKE